MRSVVALGTKGRQQLSRKVRLIAKVNFDHVHLSF
jgi:hypothetical protein